MTHDENILWRSGVNTVSSASVQTRRLTVSLDDIDVVEINRPLLVGATTFAVAIVLLAFRFRHVLLASEFLTLMFAGVIAVLAGVLVARVQLHSLSIDGIAIMLPVWTARAMRTAIDEAISGRKKDRRPNPRRIAP